MRFMNWMNDLNDEFMIELLGMIEGYRTYEVTGENGGRWLSMEIPLGDLISWPFRGGYE